MSKAKSQPSEKAETTIAVRLARVTGSEIEMHPFPSSVADKFIIALQTDNRLELDDAKVVVEFEVSATLNPTYITQIPEQVTIEDLHSAEEHADALRGQIQPLLHVKVKSEFTVHIDGKPAPVSEIPLLGVDIFTKLVGEAYATTRGYVSSMVHGTMIEHLVLPLAKAEDFLIGDIREVLTTGKLPERSATDVPEDLDLLDPEQLGARLIPLIRDANPPNTAAIRQLVEAGAHVNLPIVEGKSPIEWARFFGHESIVEILSESGTA